MDISQILQMSIDKGASDLYLSTGATPYLRINGDLHAIPNMPVLDAHTANALIMATLDKEQQRLFETSKDIDLSYTLKSGGSFRVNVFQQINGIAAVFRVIPQILPTLDSVGFPENLRHLLNLTSGLILVTGPTGCGKSTTLAAMIDYINNNRACHIITIEDPIEFVYQNKKSLIDQRQVHRDTASFTAALRAALREAPDVLLVGEMRDLETIRLVLTAAETGHLVLGTLHTSSAPRAINRIVDVFPAGEKNIIRNLVSESIQAVICQTLLKTLAGGRAAAYEVMLATPAIRNLIREDKVAQMYSVIQTSFNQGMCTMEQYINRLIANHIISPEAGVRGNFQRDVTEKS